MNKLNVENRLALLITGVIGIVVAIGLGLVSLLGNDPPQRQDEAFGRIMLTVILAFPYVLILIVIKLRRKLQAPLLTACTIVSVISSWCSGVGIIFLPLIMILGTIAIISFKTINSDDVWGSIKVRFFTLILLAISIIIGSSCYILFAGEDPRCWEFTTYGDKAEWKMLEDEVPANNGHDFKIPSIGPLHEGVTRQGVTCVDNIITNHEAGLALAMLLFASTLGFVWTIAKSRTEGY